MKFKIDENLPSECASLLREAGFEADTVASEGLSGAADEALASRSREEGRILITLDLDFANPLVYPPAATPGIIVLRSKVQDKLTLMALLGRLVRVLNQRSPEQQLWIVEADRIRFRGG